MFNDGGSEQNPDGSYSSLSDSTKWYAFENIEMGVLGYFQFINISNYSNLKGVTDPYKYLQNIKEDGYATSLDYVDNVYSVIKKWDLTKYDNVKEEFNMSNSSLVTCTVKSPNHSGARTHSIDRITPHCVVGQLSASSIGGCFTSTSRQASCNYGIGTEGGVCLIVDEANRSWCSSSNSNDQRSVTIECASDKTHPYAFNSTVYNKLVDLCVDICKRNGKKKLIWIADKNTALAYNPKSDEMQLTVHRWFANKSCPGNWMYARMGDLASKVTAALGGDVKPADTVKPTPVGIKAGDLVTITGSTYYNGKAIPGWVKKLRWYVVEVSGDRTVINKDESGRYAIMSPVKTSALAVAGTKPSEDYRIHTVVHGDTLWAIAKKYLGNGSRYKEIVSLNGLKSNVIYSGMKLKIPNK